MNYLMVVCASGCLTTFPASLAALGVHRWRTAGVSDTEMAVTDPGAGEDAYHVIKVLRFDSGIFGSG